jgi:hypothetical protein
MWNLSKLLSALWVMLGTIALLTLFIVYANFQEQVDLSFFDANLDFVVGRDHFFLVFGGSFLLLNLVIFTAIRSANALKKVSKNILPDHHLRFLVSVKVLVCGANIFLITLMIFVKSSLNTQSLPISWEWMVLMLGPLIMCSGLIFLLTVMFAPVKQG